MGRPILSLVVLWAFLAVLAARVQAQDSPQKLGKEALKAIEQAQRKVPLPAGATLDKKAEATRKKPSSPTADLSLPAAALASPSAKPAQSPVRDAPSADFSLIGALDFLSSPSPAVVADQPKPSAGLPGPATADSAPAPKPAPSSTGDASSADSLIRSMDLLPTLSVPEPPPTAIAKQPNAAYQPGDRVCNNGFLRRWSGTVLSFDGEVYTVRIDYTTNPRRYPLALTQNFFPNELRPRTTVSLHEAWDGAKQLPYSR